MNVANDAGSIPCPHCKTLCLNNNSQVTRAQSPMIYLLILWSARPFIMAHKHSLVHIWVNKNPLSPHEKRIIKVFSFILVCCGVHRTYYRNCALNAYNFDVTQQIIMKVTSTTVQYAGCLLCKFKVRWSNMSWFISKKYCLPSFDQLPTGDSKARADSLL